MAWSMRSVKHPEISLPNGRRPPVRPIPLGARSSTECRFNQAAIGPFGRYHHLASRACATVLQLSVRSLFALHLKALTGQGMKGMGDHDTVRNRPVRNAPGVCDVFRRSGQRRLSDRLGSAHQGVAKLTKTVGALKSLGLVRRRCFRDRTTSVRRRADQIAAWLRRRRGEAKDEVLTLTGELATIAEASIKDAQVVAPKRSAGAATGERGGRPAPLSSTSSEQSVCSSRSSSRPPHASPARSLTDRRGSSRPTTPTPVPSPRDASGTRSSSASGSSGRRC